MTKYIIGFIAGAVVFLSVSTLAATGVANPYVYECPTGQYPIGNGVCKNEPTGCPYGDSIPLDSPKCAPPVEDRCDD